MSDIDDIPWPSDEKMAEINAQNIADAARERVKPQPHGLWWARVRRTFDEHRDVGRVLSEVADRMHNIATAATPVERMALAGQLRDLAGAIATTED